MKLGAAVRGLAAGLAGVAAMTAAEKREQRFTRRPNSFVPTHTMERLMRLPARPDEERLWMNWAMHWGQGVLLGAVRGLMAERGVRGPVGSFAFMNLRLLNDQTLENATGVGAPPVDVADRRAGHRPAAQGDLRLHHRRGRRPARRRPPDVPEPRKRWTAR